MKFYNIILLCVIILILIVFYIEYQLDENTCESFKGRNKSIIFDLYNRFENESFIDMSCDILDVNIIQAKGKNTYENLTSSKNLDGVYVSKKIAYPVSFYKLRNGKKEGFTVLNGFTQKYDTVGTYAPYHSPQNRMKEYVSDSDDDEDDVESVTYTWYEKLANYYEELFEPKPSTIENMNTEASNTTTLSTVYTTMDEPLSINNMYISRVGKYGHKKFRLFLNSDKMYYTVHARNRTRQNIFKKQNDIFGHTCLERGNVLHYDYHRKLLFSSRNGILFIDGSGRLMHKRINRKFLRHKKHQLPYQVHFTNFLGVNDTMNLYGGQSNIKEIEKSTKIISSSDDSLTHSLSFSNDSYHILNLRHHFNFKTRVQSKHHILSIIQIVFKNAASLKNYVDAMKGFTIDHKYVEKSSYFDKHEGSDAKYLIIFNDKSFSLSSLKNWLKNYYSKTDKDIESYYMLGYTF